MEVVGVRFKSQGKIYYFSPAGETFDLGDSVIVDTVRGREFGTIAIANKDLREEEVKGELKEVVRRADHQDLSQHLQNRNDAREAIIICQDLIKKHDLPMRLISNEYTFDRSKLLFYFTAENRVDFRALVRDLAQVFKTRIELRQIGVRDEAKVFGGLGSCGRVCCCSSFLSDFSPVTIKMAKDQGLSLNPNNISGICGRLMCCLKYEQDGYEAILEKMPSWGDYVKTPDGVGRVTQTYPIQELVVVRFEREDEVDIKTYEVDEVQRARPCQVPQEVPLEDEDEEV
ncbi:MAG: stage 0 sporulation family protein [Tissierellia bacterium]|nr:stage 0 sporulation family protein [Tissierellia bacterium]